MVPAAARRTARAPVASTSVGRNPNRPHRDMNPDEEYQAIEAVFSGSGTADAIAGLSDDKRQSLRQYWLDRADGELTTALSFEFMLDDLRTEGAPAPLLELAASAVADEHAHTDWCSRWAQALGDGEPVTGRLRGTRPLRMDGASDHDNRILRTVFGSCFSETVAVHVLTASQAVITLPSARSLNHRHLKDELRHSRLGWGLLAWDGLTDRDRGMIAAHVPEMTELTRDVWLSAPRPADDELHGFGFLSADLISAAYDDAIEHVILPGFAHHRVT